jgi:sialidase-1
MVPHSMTRREALQGLSLLSAGLVLGNANSVFAAPTAKVLGTKVISDEVSNYCGWPTLARRGSGELLVVCSGGRESHVCPFGRVELIRSHDNGETWTYPEVLLDGPIDDRDAGVLETAKGTLLVTTFTSLAYEPQLQKAEQLQASGAANAWPAERLKRWQGVHSRISEKQRKDNLGTWMIRSTDGGVTWSGRYDCRVNSPHGPIQLTDGRLLHAGKQLWLPGEKNLICVSEDDGQTWQKLADVPTRNGDNPVDYHELHAVEAKDGTLIVQIRNHNPKNDNETLQTESKDAGKTWTEPHPIGVWGLPTHLLRLRDGRLLMSYGYRRQPFGNQARLSEDNGQSWSEPITISADGAGGDLGYPSTVELADGSLLTVWYEKMKGSTRAVLRQAKWTLSE